jgi:hypothetical protein
MGPTIDGVADDALWGLADTNVCHHHFAAEKPTDTLTWQAAWDEDSIYIFVTVIDNFFAPVAISHLAGWQSDKVEIYFDVNAELVEDPNVVGTGGAQNDPGHSQVNVDVPPPYDTTGTTLPIGTPPLLYGNQCLAFHFASVIDGANEYWEYAVAISTILDGDGIAVAPASQQVIGFDVDFIDCDSVAGVWTNHMRKAWGYADSWGNMDTCGIVTFSNDPPLGIINPVEEQGMITPTLVTDVINVSDVVTDLAIYNAVGQLVMKVNVTNPVISVANLNKGVYFVKMQVKGKSFTTRIIKQ